MKVKFKKEVEADARYLDVKANVRCWDDATVNGIKDEDGGLIPCRQGDLWKPIIDIDKGIITNWEKGKTADIHYKICDAGVYTVLDNNTNILKEKDGYVPNILSPGGSGYGDYIIMKIDESGKIENWEIDLDDIFEDEEG